MTAVTPDLLDALEEAAKGATGGRWRVTHDPLGTHVETDLDHMGRIVKGSSSDRGPEFVEPDATFIATADPPTVLALVAEVRRLWEVVERVEALANRWEAMPVHPHAPVRLSAGVLREALYGDLTASQGETAAGSHDDGEGRSGAREGER